MSLVICVGILLFVGASQVGSEGVPKGTLTISAHEVELTLDPIHCSNQVTLKMVRPLMFDPLIKRDQNNKIVSALATSWKAIDDTTWEFELRKGVKLHNSEPFNAQSVKTTFDFLLDTIMGEIQAHFWSGIKNIEIVDDFTVRIHTIKTMECLLNNLTLRCYGFLLHMIQKTLERTLLVLVLMLSN